MEAGLADIQKFEKQLENYSFLGWLNNFLKLRNNTRTNLKNDNDNVDSSSNEEDEKDDMPAISDDNIGRMSGAESSASEQSPKERWVQAWPVLNKAQAEIKANPNPTWCKVVGQTRRKSKKKKEKDSTQQNDLPKVLKISGKKRQQFSQKK